VSAGANLLPPDDLGLGFKPLKPARPRAATGEESDDLGFIPLPAPAKQPGIPATMGRSASPTMGAPAALGTQATGLSAQPPASLWERVKRVFTEGIPRYSTRTVENPKYGTEQLVTPEAALSPLEQRKHPIATGAAEFAGGLTSPENVALIAGTGGLGELPGAAGRLIPRLVSAGFSAQMLHSAYEQYPDFKKALDTGDYSTAERLATEMGLTVGAAALGTRHAIMGKPLMGRTAEPKPAAEAEARPVAGMLPPARQVMTPPAPADTSFVRGIPAEPAQREIRGLLPAAREPLVTPPPADTSFVRGIPAGPPPQAALNFEREIGFKPAKEARPVVQPAGEVKAAEIVEPGETEYPAGTPVVFQRAGKRMLGVVKGRAEGSPFVWVLGEDAATHGVKPSELELAARPAGQPAAPRPALPPVEKAETTGYQHQQAQSYINLIRNPLKRGYAQDYLRARLEGGAEPERGELSVMGAQAVRQQIEEKLRAEKPAEPSAKYSPDLLEQAHQELRAAHELWSNLPAPGRFERVSGAGTEAEHGEGYYGVTSPRPSVESMFPWLMDAPEITLSKLRDAVAKGKGAEYNRLIGHVADHIQTQREEASGLEAAFAELDRLAAEERAQEPVKPAEEPEGVLPGMAPALAEQREAVGRRQGERLTEELNRPLESVEAAAGEMERKAPLFRGTEASPQRELLTGEEGTISADLLHGILTGRLPAEAWREHVAHPLIQKLGLGEKYSHVKAVDPEIADRLQLLDNAPSYLRAKAGQHVENIIGGLTRDQERLFTLMADEESRENLKKNHPDEYRAAMSDPAIQDALKKYRPIERELTAARERIGGATLDRDYLRRVYETHVAGIGREQAPGEPPPVPFDRIAPQRVPGMSREVSAEYHYEHGLHEFGPAFGAKFIGTHLAALRDSISRDFIQKATPFQSGADQPRSITYEGKTFFRPDIAAELGEPAYAIYDPTTGLKYPGKTEVGKFYLGPRQVVRTLENYHLEGESTGAFRRFMREQVIGFGFGLPHIANILRRVMQSEPGAALNPRAWADAWKVAFNKELRARGIAGLDDPAFDKLAQRGSIAPSEMQELKKYWGGNLNPANWLRSMAQIGHRLLFEPGTFGGFGGIDQRARLWVADYVKSQAPHLSDAEVARVVNDTLGDYNRRNWSENQRLVSKFMLFPGWDVSSFRWVLQHPIKTTVPGAVLVLLANQALHQAGVNRDDDAFDTDTVHIGDRSIGVTLLRESMARNLLRPAVNYARAKMRGEPAGEAALYGVEQGARGVAGTLLPPIPGAIALAANRKGLFAGGELFTRADWNKPGVALPNAALDNLAALVVRSTFPAIDRIMGAGHGIDFTSFAGSNVGLPNYRVTAEQRLHRNAAEAAEAYHTVQKLAESDRSKAQAFVREPRNAALLMFHSEFEGMSSQLKRLDEAERAVQSSKLTSDEKRERLARIDRARRQLLQNADGLDKLLFQKMHRTATAPAPVMGKRPATMGQAGAIQ
jgi:hypothetical protein